MVSSVRFLILAGALVSFGCLDGTKDDAAGSSGAGGAMARAGSGGDATQAGSDAGGASGGAGGLGGTGGQSLGGAMANGGAAGSTAMSGGNAGTGADPGDDDALIVPENLTVMPLPGGNGVLNVIALTLRQGPKGPELYAALRNEGDVHACSSPFSVELFDENEQSLANGIGGLLTHRFFRTTDGTDAIAACIGPGDVSMVAITEWAPGLLVEDVRYAVYRTPYHALEVTPIDGLTIEGLEPTTASGGTAYQGVLVNGFDVAVRNPSVTVFVLNRVGRPLGTVTATDTVEIPPGGTWSFETSAVSVSGVDYVAYAAGVRAE